jgi:hypothetical protein
MKKIFDVETMYKGIAHKETVHADTAEEAYSLVEKKYSQERITRIVERKNITN